MQIQMTIDGITVRQIPGYSDYFITNDGQVWSNKSNKWLLPYTNASGYRVVYLIPDCGTKNSMTLIHRVVLLAWIGPPNGKRCTNHKDLDRINNHVDNLEWCTHSENTRDWMKKLDVDMRYQDEEGNWHWGNSNGNTSPEIYDANSAKTREISKRNFSEYRKKNPEEFRKKNAEHQRNWVANNPEKAKAKYKNLKLNHPDKYLRILEQMRLRRRSKGIQPKKLPEPGAPKPNTAEYQRNWAEQNPERVKEYAARKKARRLKAAQDLATPSASVT